MKKQNVFTLAFVSLVAIAVLFVAFQGFSDAEEAQKLTPEKAREILAVLDPGISVSSVEPGPVQGLWEVVIESRGKKSIVYIDSTQANVIIGSIVNLATKTNLTKEKFDDINRVDVTKIPLDDAIVMGDASAPNKVIVFDDPD